MRKRKISVYVVLMFICTALFGQATIQGVSAAASDLVRLELEAYIQNVANSDGYVYDAKDSAGNQMDGAKIIENPSVSGQFIAVYHTYKNGVGRVNLATSTNLTSWTFVRSLAGSSGNDATQPTIKAVGTAFMMAWEQEPNNHIRIVYYNSWTDLQNGTIAKSYNCPRQQSTYAEGTPNIYSATANSADIGFHYYKDGKVDRQARGQMTNWNSWTSAKQTGIDNAILYWGPSGNIGDRDAITFKGYDFLIMEAGGNNSDFGSWRCYLYDVATGNADKLSINTHNQSNAFANPTIQLVTINSKQAILCTQFIPSQNSGTGEPGCCIYYNYIGDYVSKVYQAENMYHQIGRADGDGWSANTTQDNPGFLVYGPYVSDIPAGNRIAIFKMMVDNNTINDDAVITIDVYDSTSGNVLASRVITRKQFLKANCYDVFRLNFTQTAGNTMEFRAYWHDRAYIKMDNVIIN